MRRILPLLAAAALFAGCEERTAPPGQAEPQNGGVASAPGSAPSSSPSPTG